LRFGVTVRRYVKQYTLQQKFSEVLGVRRLVLSIYSTVDICCQHSTLHQSS